VVARALAAGSRSIAYTYTEPTVFYRIRRGDGAAGRPGGARQCSLVTNGYQTPEAARRLAPLVQAANVDLKSFDDRFYRKDRRRPSRPVLASLVACVSAASGWK